MKIINYLYEFWCGGFSYNKLKESHFVYTFLCGPVLFSLYAAQKKFYEKNIFENVYGTIIIVK